MPRRPHRPENILGLVGMCSVVIATILSPTGSCGAPLFVLVPMGFGGLGVCAISLAWKPRWPGYTGLAVGVSCLTIWACIFGWPLLQLHNQASRYGMNIGQYAQMCMSAMGLFEAAEAQRLPNGAPPASVAIKGVYAEYEADVWGHPCRYIVVNTPRGFTFVSDGADGLPGTSDDIDLSTIQVLGTFELPPISAPAPGSAIPSDGGR